MSGKPHRARPGRSSLARFCALAGLALLVASAARAGELTWVESLENGQQGIAALDYPLGMAVSPDDGTVYVSSFFDSALLVFERNASTGLLTLLEEHVDGVNFVDGLAAPRDVVASADGRHVYGVGNGELAIFERDLATGRLTFLDSVHDGEGGVQDLQSPERVALSRDGRHLYVPARLDDAIVVFARDTLTGALSFVQSLSGPTDAACLDGPFGSAVSPDDRHVYVANQAADAVCIFARSPTTGTLTLADEVFDGVAGVVGLGGAHAVEVSGDGRHVYVVSLDADRLVVFEREATTGGLTWLSIHAGSHLIDPTHVSESPDGRRLYVAASGSSAVSVYARSPATGTLDFLEARRAGPPGIPTLEATEELVPSHDGRHVYVAGRNTDAVVTFSVARFAYAGFLQEGSPPVSDALDRPHDVAISPDGRHAYVASLESDAIAILEIDSDADRLEFLGAKRDGEIEPANSLTIAGLDEARGVAVSPDGRQVYAVGATGDGVVWLDRAADGQLTYRGTCCNGTGIGGGAVGAAHVAVSPDGAHVYVTSHAGDTLKGFTRNLATGELTTLNDVIAPYVGDGSNPLLMAHGLGFDPNGERLYVTTTDAGGRTVTFFRDPTTGILTLEDTIGNDSSTRDPVVTSDGENLFVAFETFDCLGVYDIEPATGLLGGPSSAACQVENTPALDDVRGLAAPYGIAISRDDAYVVGVGHADGGFALFARDAVSGELALAQTELDGVGTVLGLAGARDAAFTPDGHYLLVVGDDSPGTVALFVPEPEAGAAVVTLCGVLGWLSRRRRRGVGPR